MLHLIFATIGTRWHRVTGGELFHNELSIVRRMVTFGLTLWGLIFVHSAEGLFSRGQGMEFSLFVLFSLCLVLWKGAGKVSIDNFLKVQSRTNG